MNRRNFFKYFALTAGAFTVMNKIPGFAKLSAAGNPDDSIKAQGYIHDATKAESSEKKFASDKEKTHKLKAGALPLCKNCKHYKEPAAGYGYCAMVQATKANGKKVYENGWCKVYMMDEKLVKA